MVNYTHLVIALMLVAVAAAMFARARHTKDGKIERTSRAAGVLFSVGAVAMAVSFTLSFLTAR